VGGAVEDVTGGGAGWVVVCVEVVVGGVVVVVVAEVDDVLDELVVGFWLRLPPGRCSPLRATLRSGWSALDSAGGLVSTVAAPATSAPASAAVRAGSTGLRTRTATEATTNGRI
jgi:hypothetical protein